MKDEYLDQLRLCVEEKGIDFTSEEKGRRIIHILSYVGFLEGVQFMIEEGEEIDISNEVIFLRLFYFDCGRLEQLPCIILVWVVIWMLLSGW